MAAHRVRAMGRRKDGSDVTMYLETLAPLVKCTVPDNTVGDGISGDGEQPTKEIGLDELLNQYADEINNNTSSLADMVKRTTSESPQQINTDLNIRGMKFRTLRRNSQQNLYSNQQWIKVAKIQNSSPLSDAERAMFMGTLYAQTFGGTSGSTQGMVHFAFGTSRVGTAIRPSFFRTGAWNSAVYDNTFYVYKDNEGWHYLYIRLCPWSAFADMLYTQNACEEYWTLEDPTENPNLAEVWNSLDTKYNVQDIYVGSHPVPINRPVVWNAPVYINSWQGTYLYYGKNAFDEVIIRGYCSRHGSLPESNQIIFNLPEKYRPGQEMQFPCVSRQSVTNNIYIIDIRISPNGDVSTGDVEIVPKNYGFSRLTIDKTFLAFQ